MPFEPGHTLSKGGTPKAKQFNTALLRALKERFGTDVGGLAKCAEQLVAIAMNKDHPLQLKAITEIRDTIQGKPMQAVEITKTNPLDNLSPHVLDALESALAARQQELAGADSLH